VAVFKCDRLYCRGLNDIGRARVCRALRTGEFALPYPQLRLAPADHRAVGAGHQHRIGRQQRADRARIAVGKRAVERRAAQTDGKIGR
jgi:hypothetical protein